MDSQTIGMLSGALVVVSACFYGYQIVQRTVKPNLTTWGLWSIIGFALLVTYHDSGAEANVWPAVFGFIDPVILFILAYFNRGEAEKMTALEKCSAVGCACSLTLWLYFHGDKEWATIALYLSIIADLFAAIPTIMFVWSKPEKEKPAGWIIYAVGYGLGMLAITEHTFSNYILPLYMALGSMTIVWPLAAYRLKRSIPMRQWI